jgi:hypothetical protein
MGECELDYSGSRQVQGADSCEQGDELPRSIPGKQRTYNVTLWRIRVTIVAIETQQCVPFVLLLAYMKLSKI